MWMGCKISKKKNCDPVLTMITANKAAPRNKTSTGHPKEVLSDNFMFRRIFHVFCMFTKNKNFECYRKLFPTLLLFHMFI